MTTTKTKLIFSTNSVRNTRITNDELGIRYKAHKGLDGVEIHRLDFSVNQRVRVGQFRMKSWKKAVDEMKLGEDEQWRAVKGWLYRPSQWSM